MKKFIQTSDGKTAEILRDIGITEIGSNVGVFTFLNSEKLNFIKDIDMSQIKFTNILCI